MAVFNMHQAKTGLSRLVALAEAGEEVVIARHNIAVARLVPVTPAEAVSGQLPGADPFEHAPDDYINKEDIAAYYRKYPQEWQDMRHRVGFAETEQARFDLTGLPEAVEGGREFTIMRGGKAVAKVVPVKPEPKPRGWGAWEGRYVLPDSFFDPLPEEELRAWEGLDEPSA